MFGKGVQRYSFFNKWGGSKIFDLNWTFVFINNKIGDFSEIKDFFGGTVECEKSFIGEPSRVGYFLYDGVGDEVILSGFLHDGLDGELILVEEVFQQSVFLFLDDGEILTGQLLPFCVH